MIHGPGGSGQGRCSVWKRMDALPAAPERDSHNAATDLDALHAHAERKSTDVRLLQLIEGMLVEVLTRRRARRRLGVLLELGRQLLDLQRLHRRFIQIE